MKITDIIPEEIVIEASKRYRSQQFGPLSPVELKEGEVSYCAAAMLLLVGHQRKSEASRRLFSAQSTQLTKQDMMAGFEEFGWDGELCKKIFITNDAYPSSVRAEKVLDELFPSLLHQPGSSTIDKIPSSL